MNWAPTSAGTNHKRFIQTRLCVHGIRRTRERHEHSRQVLGLRERCEGRKEFCWDVPSAQNEEDPVTPRELRGSLQKNPKRLTSSSQVARKQARGGNHAESSRGHNETELARKDT